MKTIDIDDDIYSHLLSRTAHIGETASSILRRELKLNGQSPSKNATSGPAHELTDFLNGPKVRFGNATDKYLAVLGEAHRQKSKEFEKIFSIRGRDRLYFARSRDEIAKSGRSTQPLQIPGTPYWAMTNSPTPQKRALLRQVLELLGFSETAHSARVF